MHRSKRAGRPTVEDATEITKPDSAVRHGRSFVHLGDIGASPIRLSPVENNKLPTLDRPTLNGRHECRLQRATDTGQREPFRLTRCLFRVPSCHSN
jgi:hypothetical protein